MCKLIFDVEINDNPLNVIIIKLYCKVNISEELKKNIVISDFFIHEFIFVEPLCIIVEPNMSKSIQYTQYLNNLKLHCPLPTLFTDSNVYDHFNTILDNLKHSHSKINEDDITFDFFRKDCGYLRYAYIFNTSFNKNARNI